MPDDSGDLAVNTRAHTHYQYARTRLRVHWAPGIPHALCFKGRKFLCKASDASRRENAEVWPSGLNVIARSACDEAIHRASKQGSKADEKKGRVDCVAALA